METRVDHKVFKTIIPNASHRWVLSINRTQCIHQCRKLSV